jgi:HNH endonuclease
MPRAVNLDFPSHLQQVLFPFVAYAIKYAHFCSSEKWGVTPYPTGLRLNVGFIEVLTMMSDHLRLLIDADAVEDTPLIEEIRFSITEGRDCYYLPVRTSVLAELPYEPFDDFVRHLSFLKASHLSLIRLAARGAFNRGSRMGHSSEAVIKLAQLLNTELPLPTYAGGVEGTDSVIFQILDTDNETFIEGALRRVVSNVYERNRQARQACLDIYGYNCIVCRFSFEETYGDIGRDFIHVHHLNPIASQSHEYAVDPRRDLRPVCPNCHAMIHSAEPALTIEQLSSYLHRQKESVELQHLALKWRESESLE